MVSVRVIESVPIETVIFTVDDSDCVIALIDSEIVTDPKLLSDGVFFFVTDLGMLLVPERVGDSDGCAESDASTVKEELFSDEVETDWLVSLDADGDCDPS